MGDADDPRAGVDHTADSGSTERPNPAAVVADADVLLADLLVGGTAREALDVVRSHSWIEWLASDALLDDAESVAAKLADPTLASDWRARLAADTVRVSHPENDHPGLATAYRGGAAHLLTVDERLRSPAGGVALHGRVPISVRSPEAFLAVFDPAKLYDAVEGVPYPGPDRDPRA